MIVSRSVLDSKKEVDIFIPVVEEFLITPDLFYIRRRNFVPL